MEFAFVCRFTKLHRRSFTVYDKAIIQRRLLLNYILDNLFILSLSLVINLHKVVSFSFTASTYKMK